MYGTKEAANSDDARSSELSDDPDTDHAFTDPSATDTNKSEGRVASTRRCFPPVRPRVRAGAKPMANDSQSRQQSSHKMVIVLSLSLACLSQKSRADQNDKPL